MSGVSIDVWRPVEVRRQLSGALLEALGLGLLAIGRDDPLFCIALIAQRALLDLRSLAARSGSLLLGARPLGVCSRRPNLCLLQVISRLRLPLLDPAAADPRDDDGQHDQRNDGDDDQSDDETRIHWGLLPLTIEAYPYSRILRHHDCGTGRSADYTHAPVGTSSLEAAAVVATGATSSAVRA